MKNNPLVLTLDFGTQSVRTALINKSGEIVYLSKKAYEPVSFALKTGYAEQFADFYWDNLVECLKKLSKECVENFDDIVGMTVTTFRDSAVLLDENNKPLRPVILWMDQRLAEAKEKLPAFHRFLFKLVGMKDTVDMNRTRTMAHWIKENEPEIWAKTKKYVNISTYINYRLTGELADSPGGLTGHYPLYYKKSEWYKEGAMKGRIFGIPQRMLPRVVKPGEVIGRLSDEIAKECGLHLRATNSIENSLDVLRHICNLNTKRICIWCLQKEVVELVHKTARSKLYIREIQHEGFFSAVFHEQLQVLCPYPALQVGGKNLC